MTILWVEISSDPPMAFYRGIRPASAPDYARPGLLSGGIIRAPLEFGGGGETISDTVTLDNGDGDLTALFSDPPLLAQALVKYQPSTDVSERTLISGQINAVSMSERIGLGIVG